MDGGSDDELIDLTNGEYNAGVSDLVVYDTEVDTHEGNRNINIRKRKVPEKEGSRRKMVDRKVKGQNVGELHKDADMGVVKKDTRKGKKYFIVAEDQGVDQGVMKKATRKRRLNSVHKQKLVIHNEKGKKKVVTKANCKRNNGKKNVGARTKHDVDRIHVRVSLWSLHRLIPNLSQKQREDVIDMGFGAVLGFKIKDVPTRLSYWLLDNFDEDACVLNVNGKAIGITRETVKDVLGLPMGSVYVEARDEADFRHPLVVEWKRQFGKKHRYYHGPVEQEMIRQQAAGGWLFKLNFLVLYFTSIGESNKNATVNLKFLQCIADEHDIPNFDWCSYIVECLVRTKKSWVRNYHYTGPVIVLLILYAYSIRPTTEYEEAELPLVNNWTVEMLNQLEQERFSPTNVELEVELTEAGKEPLYLPSLSSTDDVSSILLSLRRSQYSQSKKKHEEIKISSIDPPMPSKSVTKSNGKRMRSILVRGDKMGQEVREAVPGNVSSFQSGNICVQGYKVKDINAPILEIILKKHGDIAAKCVFTDSMRTSLLEVVCEIVRLIETNDATNIISKMEEIQNQVTVAEASKIDVSWLRVHLETILKRNEAQEKKTSLMEMTTNTMLVKRAARTDLKEIYDKLVAAQIQFKEAKKCVKVLDLVEKKLNSDALEFKTEKYLLDV
ncbi:peptidase C48, SUMO/sentrin/Ubl1 [Tanacetum coccineum]